MQCDLTVDWTYTREAHGDLKVGETQKYGNITDRTVTYTYKAREPGGSLQFGHRQVAIGKGRKPRRCPLSCIPGRRAVPLAA